MRRVLSILLAAASIAAPLALADPAQPAGAAPEAEEVVRRLQASPEP